MTLLVFIPALLLAVNKKGGIIKDIVFRIKVLDSVDDCRRIATAAYLWPFKKLYPKIYYNRETRPHVNVGPNQPYQKNCP
jgi:hypothetical protein